MTATIIDSPGNIPTDIDEFDEISLYFGKKSYWGFAKEIGFGVGLIIVGSVIYFFSLWIALSLMLMGTVIIIWISILRNYYEEIEVIPGKQITLYNGILNKKSREIPLDRAEVNRGQTVFQRMVNVGDIVINIQGDEAEIYLFNYKDFKTLSSLI